MMKAEFKVNELMNFL